MSNLLGGNSKSNTSSSSQTGIYNQNNGLLQGALGGAAGTTSPIAGFITQLLTSPSSDNSAYKSYQDSTGFQNQLDTGTKAITNNAATAGLLNSGATLKALDTYGTGLANQNFNSYLSNLLNLGGLGNQAAGVLASSGGVTNTSSTSNGKSSSKTGLGL